MILHVLIAMIAGWIQRHQQQVIAYLQEENCVLKAQLGGRRLRLTDTERRRLAALAHPLGRQRLKETATIATPDTLLRWYKRLIAQKFDGSQQRRQLGRPRVEEEVEQLVVRMATENPSWGYRRIQGALANLGHSIDKLTVRNILRRQHMEPAPQRRKAGMSWAQFLKMHWEVLAATDFFTVGSCTWLLRVNISGSSVDHNRNKKVYPRELSWHPSGPLSPGATLDAGHAHARRLLRLPPVPLPTTLRAHTPTGCGHGGTRKSSISRKLQTWSVNPAAMAGVWGCQRFADPVPCVGSGSSKGIRKLACGRQKL